MTVRQWECPNDWSVGDLRRQVEELKSRQEEHLQLIRQLSTDSISETEAEEMRSQIAALIAEVGTLRAKLKAELEPPAGKWER